MTEREKIIKRLRSAELSKRSVFNLEHVVSAIDCHDIYDEWTFDECKQLRDKLIDLLSTGKKNERITDELRKWLDKYTMRKDTYDEMIAIIDRIDITHDEALSKVYMDMSDSEWMRLPKDADGEYIHVGDEVCGYGWPDGGVYCKAIINECMILVGEADQKYSEWIMWDAEDTLHYHGPTVEDLLDEFVERWHDTHHDDIPALKAEYAAKLRLAGDAE